MLWCLDARFVRVWFVFVVYGMIVTDRMYYCLEGERILIVIIGVGCWKNISSCDDVGSFDIVDLSYVVI